MSREPHPVRIEPAVLREISQHAAAAYPEEGCGALLGVDTGWVRLMLPLATRGARMDVAVQAEAESRGLKRIGSWHSHPQGLALPRESDRRSARRGGVMLIVAVDGRSGPGEISAWRVDPHDRHFRGVPIEDGDELVSILRIRDRQAARE